MAKKKIVKLIKLQIPAGKATPAPPIGPALGAAKVNIMEFCKQYNAATEAQVGNVLPVEISVYSDNTFTFITKMPPVPKLILKALGLESGSKVPNRDKIGKLTAAQVDEIVKQKEPDMRAYRKGAAHRLVAGTARSMGVDIEG